MLKETSDNSINFSKSSYDTRRHISSKSKFFKLDEYIIVKVYDDKIVISKPTIDYGGKCIKVSSQRNGTDWLQFDITGHDLPLGKLEFDPEESNEDTAVIYLK